LGETEAKLRALFSRARAAAPCILFLDELDAITAKRGDGGDADGGAGSVHARVLSTLLNEMDGVASTSSGAAAGRGRRGETGAGGGVLVLAATNRRDALDAALLRPGRLHESVELGVPGREDREGVLRVHAGRLPLAAGVDLARLSGDDVSAGLTCADLEVIFFFVVTQRRFLVVRAQEDESGNYTLCTTDRDKLRNFPTFCPSTLMVARYWLGSVRCPRTFAPLIADVLVCRFAGCEAFQGWMKCSGRQIWALNVNDNLKSSVLPLGAIHAPKTARTRRRSHSRPRMRPPTLHATDPLCVARVRYQSA